MASDLALLRSSVPGKIPTTAALELGRLAINTYDGKLYLKKLVGETESIILVNPGLLADESVNINDIQEGQILAWNATLGKFENVNNAGGGVSPWSVKSANYTANIGDRLITNSTAGAFVITLPPNPTEGSSVEISDGYDWTIEPVTVARNTQTIEGLEEDLVLDVNAIQVSLIFDGTTWQVYVNAGPTTSIELDDTTATALPLLFGTSDFTGILRDESTATYTPSTGTISATQIVASSDIRLKKNIQPIVGALDTIDLLSPVDFQWINTDAESMGLIAQEVEGVLPSVVTESAGIKRVDYIQLVSLLIKAVQELRKELKDVTK